jgi:hypothetical protein
MSVRVARVVAGMSPSIGIARPRICQTTPEWLASSGWVEHLPIAMWLVSVMQPRVLVELGTYLGTSYCGFCQAIATQGPPTRVLAVDTWLGDAHSGSMTPESLANFRAHHDPRYGTFSTLLQMTFDEAVTRFRDCEIDLLHIDGYHTYEAVRHDFEIWRSKLSPRSVILFHDVAEPVDDFGVWKLWDELISQFPSFTFEHEHGLGVLAVGSELPQEIQTLVTLPADEAESIRGFFRALGSRIRLQMTLDSTLAKRDAYLRSLEQAIDAKRITESNLEEAHQNLSRQREYSHNLECELSRLKTQLDHLTNVEQENHRLSNVEQENRQLRVLIDKFQERATMREQKIAELLHERDTLHEQKIAELQASISWRLTHRLGAIGRLLAPRGSRRRKLLKRTGQLVVPSPVD